MLIIVFIDNCDDKKINFENFQFRINYITYLFINKKKINCLIID